jgi:hypothetical protein
MRSVKKGNWVVVERTGVEGRVVGTFEKPERGWNPAFRQREYVRIEITRGRYLEVPASGVHRVEKGKSKGEIVTKHLARTRVEKKR